MITLREYDAARNVATYTVDTEAEIAQLPNLVTGDDKNDLGPIAMGSVAICLENMTLYMLDGNNEYVAFGSGNGGGGGGGTPNAVQYVPQTLTDAQKLQARINIGAADIIDSSDAEDGYIVTYDEEDDKLVLAAPVAPTGFVSYANDQELTYEQQVVARKNIDAMANFAKIQNNVGEPNYILSGTTQWSYPDANGGMNFACGNNLQVPSKVYGNFIVGAGHTFVSNATDHNGNVLFGKNHKVANANNVVFNIGNNVYGWNNTVFGQYNTAGYAAVLCTAMGEYNDVSGRNAVAIGNNNHCYRNGAMVVGEYGEILSNGDELFAVGGGNSSARKNVFSVSRSGFVSTNGNMSLNQGNGEMYAKNIYPMNGVGKDPGKYAWVATVDDEGNVTYGWEKLN